MIESSLQSSVFSLQGETFGNFLAFSALLFGVELTEKPGKLLLWWYFRLSAGTRQKATICSFQLLRRSDVSGSYRDLKVWQKVLIAEHLRYLDEAQSVELLQRAGEVARMLNGLMTSLTSPA